jgi:hypothetical protein
MHKLAHRRMLRMPSVLELFTTSLDKMRHPIMEMNIDLNEMAKLPRSKLLEIYVVIWIDITRIHLLLALTVFPIFGSLKMFVVRLLSDFRCRVR